VLQMGGGKGNLSAYRASDFVVLLLIYKGLNDKVYIPRLGFRVGMNVSVLLARRTWLLRI
jgi:tRNA splicing endonuclease